MWSKRNDASGWLNLDVNVIILVLTVEIIRLNRLNVYLNNLNVENNKSSARSGAEILSEVKQINQKLEGGNNNEN